MAVMVVTRSCERRKGALCATACQALERDCRLDASALLEARLDMRRCIIPPANLSGCIFVNFQRPDAFSIMADLSRAIEGLLKSPRSPHLPTNALLPLV